MKRWLQIWFLLSFVLASSAHAGHEVDWIVERGVWLDEAATADYTQAQMAQYTPYTGVYAGGYGSGASWFKLRLRAAQPGDPEQIFLRMRPPYHDHIEVFDPLLPTSQLLGDWYPRARVTHSGNSYLPLPTDSVERDLYVRVLSTGSHMFLVGAYAAVDVSVLDRVQERWAGLLLAIVLLIMLWSIYRLIVEYERLMMAFVMKQILFLLFTLGFMGFFPLLFGEMVFWPYDKAFSVIVVLLVMASFWLSVELFAGYAMPRWFVGFQIASYSVLGFAVAGILFGVGHVPLETNMYFILISPFIFWSLAMLYRPASKGIPMQGFISPHRMTVAYFAAQSLLSSFFGLPRLGFIQANELVLNIPVLYGLLSSFLMMTLLHIRQRQQRQAQVLESERRSLAEQELSLQRLAREEQGRLFDLLAHELRNPLATIQIAASLDSLSPEQRRQDISESVEKMKGLLERCMYVGQGQGCEGEAKTERLALRETLEALVTQLDIRSDAIEMNVRLRIEDAFAYVWADRQFLETAISNLLQNALRYRAADTKVQVQLADSPGPGGYAGHLLTISNIPGDAGWPDAQMLFEKFYRSRGAQNQSGTGVGLHLVKKLIQDMGGYVIYAPTDSRVRFEVWLPKAD